MIPALQVLVLRSGVFSTLANLGCAGLTGYRKGIAVVGLRQHSAHAEGETEPSNQQAFVEDLGSPALSGRFRDWRLGVGAYQRTRAASWRLSRRIREDARLRHAAVSVRHRQDVAAQTQRIS